MYKRGTRILSMIMVLVMLFSVADIPIVSYAHAEGTAGDTIVSDTPEALLSLGEWQYWIEDGLAIVAGYTNLDEEALTIPYQLGGYPVAGIGHRAFSANSELKEIIIHTNVTSIASDAFAGLNFVTICAYHGAYALNYAVTNRIAYINLSSVAEFAENAIDLTGLSSKAYHGLSDYSVVFTKNEATFLKVGQAVYFPPQVGYPTGLAAKIVSISYAGEELNVVLDRPDEGTIFKALHLEDTVQLDWDHAVLADGCTMEDVSGEASYSKSIAKKLYVKIPLDEARTKTLAFEYSLSETATISVDIGWKNATPRLNSASVSMESNQQIKATYSEKLASEKDRLGSRIRFPLADLPFVSNGAITGFITLEVSASITGEISVNYSIQSVDKWELKNGKLSHTVSKNSTFSGAATAKLKCGPELKVYFVIGFAKLGIRFFELTLGAYYEAEAKLTMTWMNGTENIHWCLNIEDKVYIELSAKLGVIRVNSTEVGGYKELKKTVTIKGSEKRHWDYSENASVSELVLTTFIALALKVDKCRLEDRKVVYLYDDNREHATQTYRVNDYLIEPSTPSRPGYRFDGWFVDARKSELPGDDYQVQFGYTKMPYVGWNGTLYIRAKWFDLCPVTSLKINKDSITGFSNVGTTETLKVTEILPPNANNKAVIWSSNNPNVATVDNRGTVTLKNAGTAEITCTSDSNRNVNDKCSVRVKQSVTGIQLNTNNIFRYSDNMSGVQLTPTVLPANAEDKSVTWSSSNAAVASVSNTGYITLNGLGTATITCRSVTNPDVTATCAIAVRQAVTGITLDKQNELRTNADMRPLKLVATVMPTNAYNKALTWTSSNTNVATVSDDGTVSMVGIGKTTITCRSVSNPNIAATFNLEIIQAVTDITLSKKAVTCYSDESTPIQLIATIEPENAGNKTVTWSTSDPSVVTVDSKGSVTVVAKGTAIVTCQSVSNPEVTAECCFTILQAVTGIDLNITSVDTTTDEVNPTYLKPTVHPDDAYNKAVVWETSDASVATVADDGTVVFKEAGQADITCRSVSTPYITDVCSVTVAEGVNGITLSERTIVRYSNQTGNVQLTAKLEAAQVADREVNWSTDNASVATVTESGIISFHSIGTATITCRSASNPNVSADCLVIVRQSVTSISLNESEILRSSDELGTVQLTASVLPANAANMDLIWESSDLAVATVDGDGLVRLVGPGTAVITCRSASDRDTYDTCSVTVHQAVNAIQLNMSNVERYTGDDSTVQLIAYVYPSYANNKDVTWTSSNPDAVTVSADGTVSILGAGDAVVTCTSVSEPEISASCNFYILQGVTSITLNKTKLNVYNDQTSFTKLVAMVAPANAGNPELIWTSSRTEIVTVSDNGELSIGGTGKAVITCRSISNPTVYATCTVTVKQAVQSILLDQTSLVCYLDDTTEYQLTANTQPSYADNKAVTWTSSNTDVVSVDSDGILTINGVGTAVITCTSAYKTSVKAQCQVTVKQPMTGIVLEPSAIELYSDDENGVQLTATVAPAETDDTGLLWRSDNEHVAVVSDNGLVMAVGKGTAHITCSSARRPEEIYAACTVTVKQHVEALEIVGNTASLLPGETVQLQATCYPKIADDRRVVWQSGAPTVASVDNQGLVTAHSYGSAVITAVTADGSELADSYTISVEHELVLNTAIEYDTLYAQGNHNVVLASVRASNGSVRRMVEAGYNLSWTLGKPDENDNVTMEIIPAVVEDRGESYDTTYVLLSGTSFDTAGSRTYTVTCSAGPHSASSEIIINVDNTMLAENVILTPSTITASVGEPILISTTLQSADDYPLPDALHIREVRGDANFVNYSNMILNTDSCELRFTESGIYTATVIYEARNISYEVNVSFYIQDSDGIVRIPADELTLNESYLVMVEGTSQTLHYAILPVDTYDQTVTWTSSDENIAIVDQNGLVTALHPGTASIACSANDGHGAVAMCAVTVEKFLQLDDKLLEYTVYTGGNDHADLGIVNVTLDSEKRLFDAGLNVTWTIEKLSGTACDISVEEFRAEAEEMITVSGNLLKLLRLNGEGTDSYRLTCRAGEYTDSCDILIHVISTALPATLTLRQSAYVGKVSEVIEIDTGYTSASIPGNPTIRIRGGNAFENALSPQYDFTEPEKLIFDRPGTFVADLIFSGDNYSYSCPITITVSDEDGNVPVNITDISIMPEYVSLAVGEQATLSYAVEPANAVYSKTTWFSSDTGIATVSSSGKVTAIGAGIAYISVTVPESDFVGSCIVVVEDGLTLQRSEIERTVFVDGITRMPLDTVQLTSASSQRLSKPPVWSLNRESGNNLTLKLEEYNTTDAQGHMIYGCSVMLYSVSRTGDTEYELVCSVDEEMVTMPITVHAVNRNTNLPSGLTFANSEYTAAVNELIRVVPQIQCLPAGTALPAGMRVALEGSARFADALNEADFCVSQSTTTLSFDRAGVFEANYIYSYSNMRYVVPVTFRITDETGNVPVLAASASLSSSSLWLTRDESAKLSAVFTPSDTENKAVTWSSTNPSVVTVDTDGLVTAVGNGQAQILCTPADTYLKTMACAAFVEDYLSIEAGEDYLSLYKQGNPINEVFFANLTQGTIQRLRATGTVPRWELIRISGNHSEILPTVSEDSSSVIITSSALTSGGTDTYRLTCTAGDYIKSLDFTVEVIDLSNAPESIGISQPQVSLDVGETATIDFTPVCYPSGTVLPQNDSMWDLYAGLGQGFHEALDYDVYDKEGDQVTVRFSKPGRYLLSRQFFLDNLHYEQTCEILVGTQTDTSYGLVKADTTDTIVYLGGTAGTLAKLNVSDTLMLDVFEGQMDWALTRMSGDSLDAILKKTKSGVELCTVAAKHEGEDIWRVTCSFGEYTESVDIKVSVKEPRNPIPETVSLSIDHVDGMMGDWLSLPIAVACLPSQSSLPETGDAFWSFQATGAAADVCEWQIENGILRTKFLQPGYYTGILRYEAGSFRHEMPVYFAITDEEGVLESPELELYLLNVAQTVYSNGQNNVVIGRASVSRNANAYYTGEAASYLDSHEASWSIRVTSGAAATLAIEKSGENNAQILLSSIKGKGTVKYTVSCTVEGNVYSKSGSFTVLDANTAQPDPTLSHSVYYAITGEKICIPTTVYDRSAGTVLQSATRWSPDAILPAIGYEYTEKDDGLEMTFYREGTYSTSLSVTIGNLSYELPFIVIVSASPITHNMVLKLPAALTAIDEYAFEAIRADTVDLRGTRTTTIGAGAFRNCTDLETIYIPASVTSIASDAFYGCLNLTIVCGRNTAADTFAQQHNIAVRYE